MQEELISFKTAKLAKEKGFWSDKIGFVKCLYTNEGQVYEGYDDDFKIPAPTQSLLQKWLRKKHNIYVIPIPEEDLPNDSWICQLQYISPAKSKHLVKIIIYPEWYKGVEEAGTYEQALEAGLYEALKLIK
jgi:hypothetical protein